MYPILIFTLINQSLLCLKIVNFFLYIELSPLSNKIHQQKYRSFEETFFHKKSLKVLVLFYVHFQHKKHMNSSKSRKLFLNSDKRTGIIEKQSFFILIIFFYNHLNLNPFPFLLGTMHKDNVNREEKPFHSLDLQTKF